MLEPHEIRQKFIDHDIAVSTSSIKKLLKSAAVIRPRNEPFKGLSFYEFFLFSKSQKASADFQQLMNDVKFNMLRTLKRRATSTIDLGKTRTGASCIIPLRKARYIRCLPSSFNPLMNHFKDEDKRRTMREGVIGSLKKIDQLRVDNKLKTVLQENTQTLKTLIGSHFSREDMDEETRRLFSQASVKAERFDEMKDRVKGNFALRSTGKVHNFPRFYVREEKCEEDDLQWAAKMPTIEEARERKIKEVKQTILRAKKSIAIIF